MKKRAASAMLAIALAAVAPARASDVVQLGGVNELRGSTAGRVRVVVPEDAALKAYDTTVDGMAGRANGFLLTNGEVGVAEYRFGWCDKRGCESQDPFVGLGWRRTWLGDAAFGLKSQGGYWLIPKGEYQLYLLADSAPTRVEFKLLRGSDLTPLDGKTLLSAFEAADVSIHARADGATLPDGMIPADHAPSHVPVGWPWLGAGQVLEGGGAGRVWLSTAAGVTEGRGVKYVGDWHCQYPGAVSEDQFAPACPGYDPTHRGIDSATRCDGRARVRPNYGVTGVGTGGTVGTEDSCAGLVPPGETRSVGAAVATVQGIARTVTVIGAAL